MGTVVVGYDASDSARAALASAIELAGALGDEVHVVTAYSVNPMGGEVMDLASALREQCEHMLEAARHQAAGLGFAIEGSVVNLPPADALVELANQLEARMIVVGSRGEHPFKGALVGSTPFKLIHIADRPVLVVPE